MTEEKRMLSIMRLEEYEAILETFNILADTEP
jgi:hypothetical protein